MTGEEIGSRLDWSASKVSRVETGRTAISAGDLRRLLDLYQVTGSLRDRLAELGRTAHQRGWWDAYGDALRDNYSTFIALENDSESERCFMLNVVPGILQTAQYAEEIMRAGFFASPPGEILRRVQVRINRQQLLTKQDPLELITILDEGVLRRWLGGPSVMADQLRHLIKMSERPNVTIHVLPFATGPHISMHGSFVVLRFPGPSTSDIVYLENMTSELFIENEAEAYHYSLAFDRLREMVLGPAESVDFIAQIEREINQERGI
jgi:transcriptional regulator with XRE-family HTH domain